MKDYKKILEGVMNIINTTEKSDIGFANICNYIGENCPELKESKDERVKRILHSISSMEVNLSKKDIIHLLRGVEIPDYKTLFEVKEIWGLGDYTGGFVDNFEWNGTNSTIWDKYSEKELYELYIKLTKD